MHNMTQEFDMQLHIFSQDREKNSVIELVKDPVCGMEIELSNAYHTELGGKIYYFCGAACKATFKKAHLSNANGRPIIVRKKPKKSAGCCG